MHRKRVNSKNLRSVGYDWWTSTLEIEFHSGGIYRYFKVPEERHVRLMESSSKGSYFHRHIQHTFNYSKMA